MRYRWESRRAVCLRALSLLVMLAPLLGALGGAAVAQRPPGPVAAPDRPPPPAAAALTPVPTAGPLSLRILGPADGSLVSTAEVTIQLAVRSAAGVELKRVSALLDNREIAQARGVALVHKPVSDGQLQPGEMMYQLSVTVPAQDAVITVRAETADGKSESLPLRLRWAGKPDAAFDLPPRLYLLAVGVSAYQKTELRLNYPAKDARDLAQAFLRQKGLLYREVNTRILVDGAASKAAILDGLEWIQRQTTAHDVAVVFLAGHGINDPGTGRYQFLPYDADMAAIKRSMLSQEELQGTLRSMAGKVLFFLDTCHSGNLLGEWATRGIQDLSPFIRELSSSDAGVVVFAASTGSQTSKESSSWGNGAFTKAAIEGLSGRAAFVKGRPITVNMLDLYISERVKQLTAGVQTPATAKPSALPDFPIAVATADALAIGAPSRPAKGVPGKPLYKRWWLWTIVGGTVAAGVVAGAVLRVQAADGPRVVLRLQP